jgi:hypothetical protein
MTRFLIHLPDSFQINNLCINRTTARDFLCDLVRRFPYPNTFVINQIHSKYSDKTERAIIFVGLQFNILEEKNENVFELHRYAVSGQKHAKRYQFKPNCLEIINQLPELKIPPS